MTSVKQQKKFIAFSHVKYRVIIALLITESQVCTYQGLVLEESMRRRPDDRDDRQTSDSSNEGMCLSVQLSTTVLSVDTHADFVEISDIVPMQSVSVCRTAPSKA